MSNGILDDPGVKLLKEKLEDDIKSVSELLTSCVENIKSSTETTMTTVATQVAAIDVKLDKVIAAYMSTDKKVGKTWWWVKVIAVVVGGMVIIHYKSAGELFAAIIKLL
ncbi:MAG: hypothetical protein WC449_05490 [Candidatus Paceibacterota bacterium]